MEFFYLVRATQKSKKPHAVFWFTDKTETRAKLRAFPEVQIARIRDCIRRMESAFNRAHKNIR